MKKRSQINSSARCRIQTDSDLHSCGFDAHAHSRLKWAITANSNGADITNLPPENNSHNQRTFQKLQQPDRFSHLNPNIRSASFLGGLFPDRGTHCLTHQDQRSKNEIRPGTVFGIKMNQRKVIWWERMD